MESTPGAFQRVKEFGMVSLVCDGKHFILCNFTDAEQVAQAYAASGGGPFEVRGVPKVCGDGGRRSSEAAVPRRAAGRAPGVLRDGQHGGPQARSFRLWRPHSRDLILVPGYSCLPFLTSCGRGRPRGLVRRGTTGRARPRTDDTYNVMKAY